MQIDPGPPLYGEAYPDGLWCHEGNMPPGLPQAMLYWRAAHDGRRVGKGQQFQTPYWNGSVWKDLGPSIGESTCAFGPDGTVYVSRPDHVDVYERTGATVIRTIPGYVGSQGIRWIKDDGSIVSGDATYKHATAALWEYTDIGDGIAIGQGLDGVVALVGGVLRRLTTGDARFVRVNRIGDAVAIHHARLANADSRRILTTVQELRTLPLVVDAPAPPQTPPTPQPQPQPKEPTPVSNPIPPADQIRRTVWTLEWQCYGKDRGDADYWVSKWQELVDRGVEIGQAQYAEHRVMGSGAGGGDVPSYGPYANPPREFFAPVPAFPGDAPAQPATPATPSDPPHAPDAPSVTDAQVQRIVDAVNAASKANIDKLNDIEAHINAAAKQITQALPAVLAALGGGGGLAGALGGLLGGKHS